MIATRGTMLSEKIVTQRTTLDEKVTKQGTKLSEKFTAQGMMSDNRICRLEMVFFQTKVVCRIISASIFFHIHRII